MTTVSFDSGRTHLDPQNPLDTPEIMLRIARSRTWNKLLSQMDPDELYHTLTLLGSSSTPVTAQQRFQILSTYLILSDSPLVITTTFYDVGIRLSPDPDGPFELPLTDQELRYYHLTRQQYEQLLKHPPDPSKPWTPETLFDPLIEDLPPAKRPQIHPDKWYEERGQTPPRKLK